MNTTSKRLLVAAIAVLVLGVGALVGGRLAASSAADDRDSAEAELDDARDRLDDAEADLTEAEELLADQRRSAAQVLALGEAAEPIADELCDCDGRVQALFDEMRGALQRGDAEAYNALIPRLNEQSERRNEARDRLTAATQ